jgi:DNA repair protein RecN (Recombination protein N)
MLAHLKVRDFVLIHELDLELSAGFNVLTGETGAGKSLVALAVDMLLGRRSKGELVRKGAKEAEIEGLFNISDEPEVKARLEEAGLPGEDELLVRRVIPMNGRHRCYVNGGLASLSLLSRMAEGLARSMGQHEQLTLLDSHKQLEMLDGFGKLHGDVEKMRSLYGQYEQAVAELEQLKNRDHDRAMRLDYLKFQESEIDRLAPADGELEQLDGDIRRMRHGEYLLSVARETVDVLYESDGAVCERLGSCIRQLEDGAKHDPAMAANADQLGQAASLVEDVARTLLGYGRGIEVNPAQLTELEDRREELRRLVRKHDTDLAGVIGLRDGLKEEIRSLEQYEETMEKAESTLAALRKRAEVQANKLSKARKRAARKLATAVTDELKDLQFGNASMEVSVEPRPSGLGALGTDHVEFLVALNPGEGAHPLRAVASGGELSRLMLAIKRVLAGVGPVGTYVFDEVDAGIGGGVAASVGRKLKEVSNHHQVICITHLPQIAGMADFHLHVSKTETGGRTTTGIAKLAPGERVEEIARMLGGEKVSAKTRAAARELIAV